MILREPVEYIVLWKAGITQNISLKIAEEEMSTWSIQRKKVLFCVSKPVPN